MNEKKTLKYIKLLQIILAVAAVYGILKFLLPVVLPFVLSFFICKMFYPWCEKLERKTRIKVTIWGCIFVVSLALILIGGVVLVGSLLYGKIYGFLSDETSVHVLLENLWARVYMCAQKITDANKGDVIQWFIQRGDRFLENAQMELPGRMASFCVRSIKWIGKAIIVLLIAFVGAILLIKNKRRIRKQIENNVFACEMTSIVARICQVFASFFRCQMIIIIVNAIVLSVGLRLLSISNGIGIGITMAFLDALPVIGSGTVLLPWAVISIITGRYMFAIALIVLYAICTVIREVLEPRLMGDTLGVNEFYVLMATFIGIALFGVSGIILGPLGMVMVLEVLKYE